MNKRYEYVLQFTLTTCHISSDQRPPAGILDLQLNTPTHPRAKENPMNVKVEVSKVEEAAWDIVAALRTAEDDGTVNDLAQDAIQVAQELIDLATTQDDDTVSWICRDIITSLRLTKWTVRTRRIAADEVEAIADACTALCW
jgi:hypothetical protein